LDPNLTPLLDVVLQLITFFMMLIHFGTQIEGSNLDVRLPFAPAALPGSDMGIDRLAVAIDREGRLIVDGVAHDESASKAWWAKQARERREGLALLGRSVTELPTVVVLRADTGVAYGTVRRAIAEAQRLGFAHFTLVVLREVRA
jgi:biopolymer transport protein ExbD